MQKSFMQKLISLMGLIRVQSGNNGEILCSCSVVLRNNYIVPSIGMV